MTLAERITEEQQIGWIASTNDLHIEAGLPNDIVQYARNVATALIKERIEQLEVKDADDTDEVIDAKYVLDQLCTWVNAEYPTADKVIRGIIIGAHFEYVFQQVIEEIK